MAESTLLIVPEDLHTVPPDVTALLADLRAQGFIGADLDPGRFEVGEAYPRLLSFMGCSPHFKTEPEHPGDRDYCHLELRGPWPSARLLGRLEDAAPRCPDCRKPDREWSRAMTTLPDAPWHCPYCGRQALWSELDWRHRAGFARFALVLHHIFEGEAVPGPALLKTLASHTEGAWTWLYG